MAVMPIDTQRSAMIIASLLFAIVITQIIYFSLSSAGADINRPVIWTTEVVAFLAMTVLALARLARAPSASLAWAAIAISGILNVVQLGIGLTMFGPLSDAGDPLAAVFKAVLASAFFLYFAGKGLFGFAAVVIGAALLKGSGVVKATGGLAIIAGLAAVTLNIAAMVVGMDMVLPAGAAGTIATLALGISIAVIARTTDKA